MFHVIEIIWQFLTTGPGTLSHADLSIAPLIIGAALGLANSAAKQEEANRERKYQAEVARWSPWTKMKSQYVKNPNMVADVMSGASMGAGMEGAFGGGDAAAAAPAETPLSQQTSQWEPMANIGPRQEQDYSLGVSGAATPQQDRYSLRSPYQSRYSLFNKR